MRGLFLQEGGTEMPKLGRSGSANTESREPQQRCPVKCACWGSCWGSFWGPAEPQLNWMRRQVSLGSTKPMELIKVRPAKHCRQCQDQQTRGTVAALTHTDNATMMWHCLHSSGASQLGLGTPLAAGMLGAMVSLWHRPCSCIQRAK